jgi:XRE family transcriptional regulator, fatty acid utilization regulator
MTTNRRSMLYLREWRQHLGVTLDDLAEKSGATASHISKVEDGHVQPGPAFVSACGKALGIEPKKLLSSPPA